MKMNNVKAMMMMDEDDEDKGSLESGLASSKTVERYEKPIRYSRLIDNRKSDEYKNESGALAHYSGD